MDAPIVTAEMDTGGNAVLLEGMRIVRCHDSPVNSVVAAGAASYILVSNHSAAPLATLVSCLLCGQPLRVRWTCYTLAAVQYSLT